MTKEEFDSLIVGDVVQSSSGVGYVILEITVRPDGRREYLGIRAVTVSNPVEWTRVGVTTRTMKLTREALQEAAHRASL